MTREEEFLALRNLAAIVRAGRVYIVQFQFDKEGNHVGDELLLMTQDFAAIFDRAALRLNVKPPETKDDTNANEPGLVGSDNQGSDRSNGE